MITAICHSVSEGGRLSFFATRFFWIVLVVDSALHSCLPQKKTKSGKRLAAWSTTATLRTRSKCAALHRKSAMTTTHQWSGYVLANYLMRKA